MEQAEKDLLNREPRDKPVDFDAGLIRLKTFFNPNPNLRISEYDIDDNLQSYNLLTEEALVRFWTYDLNIIINLSFKKGDWKKKQICFFAIAFLSCEQVIKMLNIFFALCNLGHLISWLVHHFKITLQYQKATVPKCARK